MKIPFFELKNSYLKYEDEINDVLKRVLSSGRYILGKELNNFENNFANYCGTKFCIGVGNGLDALTIIIRAYKELGIFKYGDEIIVPANTYIATILSIFECGLKPILIEPNIETYNIDPSKIENLITNKTKGLMVVHLYGQLAPMDEIKKITSNYKLILIEDSAQSHGASYRDGRKSGGLSDAAGFSFYPSKNLGTLGDSGAITTNDENIANLCRLIRNYGSGNKYYNQLKGVNSRLDEIHAAILNIKLKYLDEENLSRRLVAKRYLNRIKNKNFIMPKWSKENDHVFHLFVIRTKVRKKLVNYLKKVGIETIIHYPIPPHKQKALFHYNNLVYPITELIHKEILSLPCHPFLSLNEQDKIIDACNRFNK